MGAPAMPTVCRILGALLLAAATSGTAIAAPPAASSASPAPPPPPPPPSGDVEVPSDHAVTRVLPDGTFVAFEPGTAARWAAAGKIASETAKWAHGFHIEMTDGEIDLTMPPAGTGEHAFLVTSKAGTLTVWRGRLHVAVRGDTTAVSIYEGSLVVGSNKESFRVSDPAALVLHKGGGADKAHLLPGVPRWDTASDPPSFAVVPQGAAATLGLAWAPVPGSRSYRVQVATDAAMHDVVRSAAVGDPRWTVTEPPQGQQLWAQVRAVGTDGVLGDWSAPQLLRTLHYRMPPGAFVARDGAVVLPEGATLALTDGDGVQVAYENVRPGAPATLAPILYWTALSGPLHPADDAPLRVVHLRDAALGAEARVTLAKRAVRARVELTPEQARPMDPIDVRVVVWDPTARVDVQTESVTLEAMADLDPVPVAWQRMGNVWTGRIGPRRDTGRPAVVRVVVRDSLAQEIGRGFIEIRGPSSSN